MHSVANRKKKRVFQSIQRRAASPERQLVSEREGSRLLHERVSQLEAMVENLSEAFDQNSRVFSESLRITEAMDNVFQRVFNDYFSNGEFAFKNRYTSGPDWGEYVRQYWLCMLMADFADWLKSLAKEEKASPGKILLPSHDDTETIIFGG
jgi:hypothetical protein